MSKRRPKPPDHLTPAARAKWLQMLRELGDLDAAELDSLTAYASAWARMVEAEQKVAETGVVIRASGGTASVSPFLIVLQQERRAVKQLGEQLRKRRPAAGASEEETDPILRLIGKAE